MEVAEYEKDSSAERVRGQQRKITVRDDENDSPKEFNETCVLHWIAITCAHHTSDLNFNKTMSYTALHCTALHCTALHCTALHCTARSLSDFMM